MGTRMYVLIMSARAESPIPISDGLTNITSRLLGGEKAIWVIRNIRLELGKLYSLVWKFLLLGERKASFTKIAQKI